MRHELQPRRLRSACGRCPVKRPFLSVLLLLCTLTMFSEENPNLEKGLKPYGTYHGGALDSVSVTNGNLTLHIPVWSYSQRGNVNVNYTLVYNNKSWQLLTPNFCSPVNGCVPAWSYTDAATGALDVVLDQGLVQTGKSVRIDASTVVWVYSAKSVDGSTHPQEPSGTVQI